MRREIVPEDMSSEQKSLFGIVSWRQTGYICGGLFLTYQFVPTIVSLFSGLSIPFLLIMVLLFGTAPLLLVAPFAFIRVKKYNMFLDRYLWTKFTAKYSKGTWRKGY